MGFRRSKVLRSRFKAVFRVGFDHSIARWIKGSNNSTPIDNNPAISNLHSNIMIHTSSRILTKIFWTYWLLGQLILAKLPLSNVSEKNSGSQMSRILDRSLDNWTFKSALEINMPVKEITWLLLTSKALKATMKKSISNKFEHMLPGNGKTTIPSPKMISAFIVAYTSSEDHA